jgi:hypothetical protein
MEQYPDSIIVRITEPATQDPTTGYWTAGTSTTYSCKCRAEVNGTGRQIPGKDGSLMDYAFTCYLPVIDAIIPEGSEFIIISGSEITIGGRSIAVDSAFTDVGNDLISVDVTSATVIAEGKVKRFSKGQLNSRLWL